MISKLTLKNFRCYENHEVIFKDTSVCVGVNNAGKSTIVEALRIISIISTRFQSLVYKKPPKWLDIPLVNYGVSPSLKNVDIQNYGIIYLLRDEYAQIEATFTNNYKIKVYINDSLDIFANIFDQTGKVIKSKSDARYLEQFNLKILPQLSLLKSDEKILNREYVKSNLESNLSSFHFRNQLFYFDELFDDFKKSAESNWTQLKLEDFRENNRHSDEFLNLQVRINNFVGEIGLMGSGMQIWLQIIWFLTRCENNSTIILDEPDVYLHADLQRKLIKFLIKNYKQVIITTHSTEIISEVPPENILLINSEKNNSEYIKQETISDLTNEIGSVTNLSLYRFASSKTMLITESVKEDFKILKIFYDKLFDDDYFSKLGTVDIDGWNGWSDVKGIKKVLTKANYDLYSVFDSDYHDEEEITKRLSQAKELDINIHVWSKKEIENFLINKNVLSRYVKNVINQDISTELDKFITEEYEKNREDLIDSYSTFIQKNKKHLEASSTNKLARKIINVDSFEEKISLCKGKKMLKSIFNFLKVKYEVSLNKFTLAENFNKSEIDQEIKTLLFNIRENKKFQSYNNKNPRFYSESGI